ncbi:hypothetical protein JTE90_001401 [Oedothorax gibbosus]|uniref:Uncharacterized protein n=1 Tax=Oedothorax gibbosus TaxID=931172 RepID=A0AAV6VF89_9ARAC|nr:hypothetical protein JTE90_001401 [Oedothorax gibbosus]
MIIHLSAINTFSFKLPPPTMNSTTTTTQYNIQYTVNNKVRDITQSISESWFPPISISGPDSCGVPPSAEKQLKPGARVI